MSPQNSRDMWVFREGRSTISGRSLLDGMRSSMDKVSGSGATRDALVDALLRAGELECALGDSASGDTARAAAITDAIANRLVGGRGRQGVADLSALLQGITAPETVKISPPEGFAYYAVHPLDFAELAERAAHVGAVAVVGIRSIGTTLSAVVAAALERRGMRAQRITVRPTGHPYDRHTVFSSAQLRWIALQRAASAEFYVVDEGPGISGSSFLSVGEALLQAGVERARITFLASRYVDPESLAAKNGADRWRSFHSLVTSPTSYTPADAGEYLGGGHWRRRWLGEESQWPPSWLQMERLKFLSADSRRMYKFHGLGRFGAAVAERAQLLGELGFGPRLLSHHQGFSEFQLVDGTPMSAVETSSAVLERMADYCALRALEIGVQGAPESQLEMMVRFNIGEEFGCDMAELAPPLPCVRAVIADGRMQPYEWLARPDRTLVKTDNATHGDDHLFPGPVDIAWDLAGGIVEWGMTAEAAHYLLDRYRQRSGDDAGARVDAYMLAYSVFRMAYCAMAAFSMRGSTEEARLRRAAQHYRALVEAQLKAPGFRLQASAAKNFEWRQGSGGAESLLRARDGEADRR